MKLLSNSTKNKFVSNMTSFVYVINQLKQSPVAVLFYLKLIHFWIRRRVELCNININVSYYVKKSDKFLHKTVRALFSKNKFVSIPFLGSRNLLTMVRVVIAKKWYGNIQWNLFYVKMPKGKRRSYYVKSILNHIMLQL